MLWSAISLKGRVVKARWQIYEIADRSWTVGGEVQRIQGDATKEFFAIHLIATNSQ
jgi:hypothetical protein